MVMVKHMSDRYGRLVGLNLAGIILNCRFFYPELVRYFRNYIIAPIPDDPVVELTSYEKKLMDERFSPEQRGAAGEERILISLISDALLPYKRMLFHSVAITLNGKAWLLTAPSGTGKTTQYLNLRKLYPDRIRIICGDQPILDFHDDKKIIVHHSPWNGKEGFGDMITAPLGGIVFLEQGHQDQIVSMSPGEAVIPCFHSINTFLKTRLQVHQLFALERILLQSVPLLKFINTGTLKSSDILFKCLDSY